MTAVALPEDDDQRLALLHRMLILDTPPAQRVDRIVQFAAEAFDVPMALFSRVNKKRRAVSPGGAAAEAAKDGLFCPTVPQGERWLQIPDATRDPRFADHPLVVGHPKLRFYAGAPLRTADGVLRGTLCLMDLKPRQLSPRELATLGQLRDLMVAELAGRPLDLRDAANAA